MKSSDTLLSTDIYEITEFYNKLRAKNMSGTASVVGLFGHMNEMFSQTIQDNLITIAETTNEILPTRAKYTKNILTHALNYGINDINATPSVMTVMIYLPIEQMNNNFTESDSTTGHATFILDKNIPIPIGDYEFHLDYDIIITRIKNTNGQYVYTAIYDLFESGTTNVRMYNPLSDIINPYITTVNQTTINHVKFLGFSVRIRQVNYKTITKSVITNNTIENKTVTFDYDYSNEQLASFDVDVTEGGITTHLTPIYNGLLDYTVDDGTWCYYDYVSENMIRILFSRDSYVPGQNASVKINIYLTKGSSGNFTFNKQFRISLKSEKYNNYKSMYAYIYPLLGGVSSGGKDRKSIKELKKIIPREASSRGAIINTADLENFFNSINDSNTNLFFKKKRDNPFDRMHYAYMVMRRNGNIYPTNTINIKVDQSDLSVSSSNNTMSLAPGTPFYYYEHGQTTSDDVDYASLKQPTLYDSQDSSITYPVTMNEDGKLVRVFEYISPFLITIDEDLITSYLMTMMNENKLLVFSSINTASDLQFISTNMQWVRNFYNTDNTYDKKYTMSVDMVQNNNDEYNLISTHTDDEGNMVFDDIRIKMFLVLYTDETSNIPYRYLEGKITFYDESTHSMTFQFSLPTDDSMDLKNRINITNVYNCKPESFQKISELETSHGYMNHNTYAKLFILADFGKHPGDIASDGETVITESTAYSILYGDDGKGNKTEIESIIPTKSDIANLFLNNEIFIERNGEQINVISIIQSNENYMKIVQEYNGDESTSSLSIMRYIRNNKNSDFIQNVLLNDADSLAVINSYNYEDLSAYTVCNTMIVDGGIDFYHDYSNIMTSTIKINPVKLYDSKGYVLTRGIERYDEYGHKYTEYKPMYRVNSDGSYNNEVSILRVPVIRNNYLNTESLMQDFISELNERRLYMQQCLYHLEDTFGIDYKFVNTWGPSKMFYYVIPSAESYNVTVNEKTINVYLSMNDDSENIIGKLNYGQIVIVNNITGQWAHISSPFDGWIKLNETIRTTTYIDNVSISLSFETQLYSAMDREIINNIISVIKEYIEDINNISEIHIDNIIKAVLDEYHEQLVYFSFLKLNKFGRECNHLYLDQTQYELADVIPEFINIETSNDGLYTPSINITVYT